MQQPFSTPLRPRSPKSGEIYPYYAGFSEAFVVDAVKWLDVRDGTILDPWLGAGTTTRTTKSLRVASIGFDLNPAMVLVAKAEQVDRADSYVLEPLSKKILAYSESIRPSKDNLPLEIFFDKAAARWISAVAMAIWLHLVNEHPPSKDSLDMETVSPLPSLLFVGLFNVVRALLTPLNTSNPTWIKKPSRPDQYIATSKIALQNAFLAEIHRLISILQSRPATTGAAFAAEIAVADSRNLPLQNQSVQGILTSPPYCTRIDYGRATMPELLVLESIGLACYERSRLNLMGSAVTRPELFRPTRPEWGETCQNLMDQIYNHPSKASQTYYYRSHYSYFSDIARSVSEISRVMEESGKAVVVVQDSYYKDIHNDLPKIFVEMAAKTGLEKIDEYAYEKRRSMCRINSSSKAYGAKRVPLESVLLFQKR